MAVEAHREAEILIGGEAQAVGVLPLAFGFRPVPLMA